MALTYGVSQRVVAKIEGFSPWPATVDSVVFNEDQQPKYVHLTLHGSNVSLPHKPENIRPLEPEDEEKWSSLGHNEVVYGAHRRNEVIETELFADAEEDQIPPELWSYVTVESDYEEVPDDDKITLQLTSLAKDAQLRLSGMDRYSTLPATRQRFLGKFEGASNNDVLRASENSSQRPSTADSDKLSVIRFPCPLCKKKFKTRMALKKHLECGKKCSPFFSASSAKKEKLPVLPPNRKGVSSTNGQKFRPNEKGISSAYKQKLPTNGKVKRQRVECPKCAMAFNDQDTLIRHTLMFHSKAKTKSCLRTLIEKFAAPSNVSIPRRTPPSVAAFVNGKTNFFKAGKRLKKVSEIPPLVPITSPRHDPLESFVQCHYSDDSDDFEIDVSEIDSMDTEVACTRCVNGKRYNCCKSRRHLEVHSEREKERRLAMRVAFQTLSAVLDCTGLNHPKNTLLLLAKDEIDKLTTKEKEMMQTLEDLQEMNLRLLSREFQLTSKG